MLFYLKDSIQRKFRRISKQFKDTDFIEEGFQGLYGMSSLQACSAFPSTDTIKEQVKLLIRLKTLDYDIETDRVFQLLLKDFKKVFVCCVEDVQNAMKLAQTEKIKEADAENYFKHVEKCVRIIRDLALLMENGFVLPVDYETIKQMRSSLFLLQYYLSHGMDSFETSNYFKEVFHLIKRFDLIFFKLSDHESYNNQTQKQHSNLLKNSSERFDSYSMQKETVASINLMSYEKSDLLSLIASKSEAQSSPTYVLYGGGPSSIPPLIAFILSQRFRSSLNNHQLSMNFLHNNKEQKNQFGVFDGTLFVGEVSKSMILSARDPQKTVKSFLEIATKYDTFDELVEYNMLYYVYLYNVHATFGMTLADSVDKCYDALPHLSVNGHSLSLMFATTINVFVLVKSVGNRFFLCCQTEKGENDFEISIGEAFKLKHDLLVRSTGSNKVLLRKNFEHMIVNLSVRHGDFHYTASFFEGWKPGYKQIMNRIDEKNKVINRAGFLYEDNCTKILAGLNYNYMSYVFSLLQVIAKYLKPLQLRCKDILAEYLQVHKASNEYFLSNERFVVIGGGRAAGELSRRLVFDKLSLEGDILNHILKSLKLFHLPADIAAVSERLTEHFLLKILLQRKRVVVVDHRLYMPIQLLDVKAKDFRTKLSMEEYKHIIQVIIQSPRYIAFFNEITKYDFLPILSQSALNYYKSLIEILNLFDESSTDPGICKLRDSIVNYFIKTSHLKSTENCSDVSAMIKRKILHDSKILKLALVKLCDFTITWNHSSKEGTNSGRYLLVVSDTTNISSDSKQRTLPYLKEIDDFFGSRPTCDQSSKVLYLKVGGAVQGLPVAPISSVKTHSPLAQETQEEYGFGRIQESHYRKCNLEFIQLIGEYYSKLGFSHISPTNMEPVENSISNFESALENLGEPVKQEREGSKPSTLCFNNSIVCPNKTVLQSNRKDIWSLAA